MRVFLNTVDQLSEWFGLCAAWLFFITGLMIGYEVLARYLFNAPTIWAQELSQLLMLIGTYMGISWAMKYDQHIKITALEAHLPGAAKKWLKAFSLVFIALLCLVALYYGSQIFWDSFERGRSTGTMLNIPNWWSEIVIPAGFGVLLLQVMCELIRLFRPDPASA